MRLVCWFSPSTREAGQEVTDMTVPEFVMYARLNWYRDIQITGSFEMSIDEVKSWKLKGFSTLTRQQARANAG